MTSQRTEPRQTSRGPYRYLEDVEQAAFVDWAQYVKIDLDDGGAPVKLWELVIAIPNGSYLGGTPGQRAFQIARLKRCGFKIGVSDLLITLPRGSWHGLWVEMKKRRGDFRGPAEAQAAVSREQRAFGALQQRLGYRHVVAYGFEQARQIASAYIEGRDIVIADEQVS